MWFIQPKQDFIAEMPWRYTNEVAVMSWQIKARNYDTSTANIELIAMVLVSLGMGGAAYLFSHPEVPMLISLSFSMIIPLVFIPLSLSITHYTTIFVYQFY
ncbi:hypothetical protein [Vreelandella zhanjiangensis]|uniref:hypothetical protein n=1 Tax=Vreelandella zhanjiangensis TaxID=1121960 RepID=UPI0003612BA2|nr:hypothetical protein [Halomonas zhanjiangensis]